MTQQANLVAIVIAMAIVIPMTLLISAVLLRAGVSLYNRFAGGPNSPTAVPEPTYTRAIGIVLVVGIINWLIGTVSGLGMGFVAEAGGLDFSVIETLTMVGSIVLGVLVMAAVLKYLLPTPLARAIGVSLCHMTVCVSVAVLIVVIGLSVSVALAASM